MKRVTIRVPATTANLGPGFDAFGCALSLYTDVTFEETDFGLEITGCDEAFTDGRFIEEIGTYDPTRDPSVYSVNEEAAKKWLANGAQPTEVVNKIFKLAGIEK